MERRREGGLRLFRMSMDEEVCYKKAQKTNEGVEGTSLTLSVKEVKTW